MSKTLLSIIGLSLILSSCSNESEEKVPTKPTTNKQETQKLFYKVGFGSQGKSDQVEWSNRKELTSMPTKTVFQNGHQVSMWSSKEGLHHHWQTLTGNHTGLYGLQDVSTIITPIAISSVKSEAQPKNSGVIWFQLVQ